MPSRALRAKAKLKTGWKEVNGTTEKAKSEK